MGAAGLKPRNALVSAKLGNGPVSASRATRWSAQSWAMAPSVHSRAMRLVSAKLGNGPVSASRAMQLVSAKLGNGPVSA